MNIKPPSFAPVKFLSETPFQRLVDPVAHFPWLESCCHSTMSHSSQANDLLNQDWFKQLFELTQPVLNVQPIDLAFSNEPHEGMPGNRIEISMDVVHMQDMEPLDPEWVIHIVLD
ncbi:tumor protein 63-like isoform X2 [Hemitrygon akajei]|uniref:tumor protein 63-like isoform X2 n=1 Tax=Hemitrygon akajei TaxID=2704970 RepID=UPI003BF9B7BD